MWEKVLRLQGRLRYEAVFPGHRTRSHELARATHTHTHADGSDQRPRSRAWCAELVLVSSPSSYCCNPTLLKHSIPRLHAIGVLLLTHSSSELWNLRVRRICQARARLHEIKWWRWYAETYPKVISDALPRYPRSSCCRRTPDCHRSPAKCRQRWRHVHPKTGALGSVMMTARYIASLMETQKHDDGPRYSGCERCNRSAHPPPSRPGHNGGDHATWLTNFGHGGAHRASHDASVVSRGDPCRRWASRTAALAALTQDSRRYQSLRDRS